MELEIIHPGLSLCDLLLQAEESDASANKPVGRIRRYNRMAGHSTGADRQRHKRPFAAELRSLAIVHARQNVGTRPVAQAVRTAREAGFRRSEISRSKTAFGLAPCHRGEFVRCGIDRDYFRKYYPAPLVEQETEWRSREQRILEVN